MSNETDLILRADKNAAVIIDMSRMFGVPTTEATEICYSSETATMIEDGVTDLQCRSSKYLAGLVWEEYQENRGA